MLPFFRGDNMLNMFLSEYWEKYSKLNRYDMTFYPSYRYWIDTLLEYPMRLFTLEGLPESIPEHEPEIISFIKGYVPIVQLGSSEWIAAPESGLYGLTDYYDIFTGVNFSTPLHFGARDIGKNAFIIRNTALKNPLMPKIKRYATLMSHAEISLICELVNLRESDVIETISDSQRAAVDQYMLDRYEGKTHALVNKGFAMIKHNFRDNKSQAENSRLWDLRERILASYLEEIGIRKPQEKRERQIVSEVEGDSPMLRLNISDMHYTRQKDWDKFNEKTGYNVRVKCNINYDDDAAIDKYIDGIKNKDGDNNAKQET